MKEKTKIFEVYVHDVHEKVSQGTIMVVVFYFKRQHMIFVTSH